MSPAAPPAAVPGHVAIVMDGNGRWAQRRHLPRYAGHRAGLSSTRAVIEESARRGVAHLTLFAFSSENWKRPTTEVGMLMDLFLGALRDEVGKLHDNGVRLRFIGERGAFSDKLRAGMADAEARTAANAGLQVHVAVNYGGRWDIAQAAMRMADEMRALAPQDTAGAAELLAARLSLAGVPDPDLFIRTGGEQRISNFLLWQMAYTELYFTDVLWPDFDAAAYTRALEEYARRERRYGGVMDAREAAGGA